VFTILKGNVSVFGCQRKVTVVNENCIPFIKKLITGNRMKPDFINFDPPWGGPNYARIKRFMLTLQNTAGRNVPIYDIINDIFERKITRFITFKAPFNFDMALFGRFLKGSYTSYPIQDKPRSKKIVYYYVVVQAGVI
jgi:hypothetical protein